MQTQFEYLELIDRLWPATIVTDRCWIKCKNPGGKEGAPGKTTAVHSPRGCWENFFSRTGRLNTQTYQKPTA